MKANAMTRWLARAALRLAHRVDRQRKPDFLIGGDADPYMERWWLIPRNRVLNIYLHRVLRPDDDRALHDHPWPSVSLILAGGLGEIYAPDADVTRGHLGPKFERWFGQGDLVYRPARFSHRLLRPGRGDEGGPAWTLFITGPAVRKWGFWCPHSWRYWRDFTDPKDTGRIGRGCE